MSMRGVFGWDLPPGVTTRDIEEAAGELAKVSNCCNATDPELEGVQRCPACGNECEFVEDED